MNDEINHDRKAGFPDDPAEREWQAQERALADVRAGRDADEPQRRAYRLIARAASQPPSLQLPADFAQRTAHAIASRSVAAAGAGDSRFERNLLWLLTAAMGVAGGVGLLLFAPLWLPAFGLTAVVLGSPWPWALATCLALSALAGRWQPSTRHS